MSEKDYENLFSFLFNFAVLCYAIWIIFSYGQFSIDERVEFHIETYSKLCENNIENMDVIHRSQCEAIKNFQ